MKKRVLMAVLICLMSTNVSFAGNEVAKMFVFFGNSQKLSEVYELPNEEYFQTDNGEHLNLGISYKVFSIFWIPLLVTEDPSFIYTVEGNDDFYYEINSDAVKSIAEEYHIADIESLKEVPFWDAWGGKILILVVILFFVFASMGSHDTEEGTADGNTSNTGTGTM